MYGEFSSVLADHPGWLDYRTTTLTSQSPAGELEDMPLHRWPSCVSSAEDEFDQAVNHEADPSVDEDSEVETKWFVAGGCGQVGHEDEEVQEAADDDGGELFDEAAEQLAPDIGA